MTYKNGEYRHELFHLPINILPPDDFLPGYWDYGNFPGANLQRANLRATHLHNASFAGANLRGVDFTNALLINADLTGANLDQAIFLHAQMDGCVGCPKQGQQ